MTTAQRRERERKQRRQAILNAARELFWSGGYTATTMPAIAREAELAPGTLYLYFPSKGALYAELLIEGYDLLIERLRAQLGRSRDPRRQAAHVVDAFIGFAWDHPQYFDVIFFVLQREAPATRESALGTEQIERLKAKEDECKALAAQVLEQARRLRSMNDPAATVDAVWSMLVGMVFYFRKTGDERFRRVAGRAKEILLDALFGPP